MSVEERRDIRTRFKRGQSGNPRGRPKGRKNQSTLIRDALFKPIRVSDGQGVRSVPKIVAAAEVCLNKALKGDHRAFVQILELAEKLEQFTAEPSVPEITVIRRIIVDHAAQSVTDVDRDKAITETQS
jgi:hypothetical protein